MPSCRMLLKGNRRPRMRIVGFLLRLFIFSIIPALLAYISSDDVLVNYLNDHGYLVKNFNIPLLKQLSLLCSVLLTSVFLILMYEFKNYSANKKTELSNQLYNDLKTSFLLAFNRELGNSHISSIKFRVFKELNWFAKLVEFIKSKRDNRTYEKIFKINKINGFSDIDSTTGLSFIVTGDTLQGLVGKCYNEGVIKYEEDISSLNALYNLTGFQIGRTRNTKFCLCVPIFNPNNKIVSIISMDCIYSIKIPQIKETIIADMITVFVQDLNKYFPKIFK